MTNNPSIAVAEAIYEGLKEGADAVSIVKAVSAVTVGIRDKILEQKIIRFITSVHELSAAQRSSVIHELTVSAPDEKVGFLLLSYIDRTESDRSAEYIGRAFYNLGMGRIDTQEFWRVAYAISVLPHFALNSLRRNENGIVLADYSDQFGAAGIATLAGGGSMGSSFAFIGRMPEILLAIKNNELVKKK